MEDKNEELTHELHERLMKEFISQISESISHFPKPMENKPLPADQETPISSPANKEAIPPKPGASPGPDKINEIRNEVAITQSVETVNPELQKELMDIAKQRSEEFKRELHQITLSDNGLISPEEEKFNNELVENTRKQLTEKSIRFPIEVKSLRAWRCATPTLAKYIEYLIPLNN